MATPREFGRKSLISTAIEGGYRLATTLAGSGPGRYTVLLFGSMESHEQAGRAS